MKAIALVKRVPDTGTNVTVNAAGDDIVRENIPFVINPYDEYALEELIRLKEGGAVTELVAVTLGGNECDDVLKAAFALGADRAVRVEPEGGATPGVLGTASALASVVEKEAPDIVFAGKQSTDGNNFCVALMVAEFLGIPGVANVNEFALDGRTARVTRETDDGTQALETELPALFTAERGLNDPRLPSLRGIMRSKKMEPEVVTVATTREETARVCSMSNPPARAAGRIIDAEFPENVKELIRLLREEAKAF